MPGELVQILATCPTCRVEAAVVELVEIGALDSLVIEGRCRLCGRIEEHGDVLHVGVRFSSADQVHAALGAWALDEGEPDLPTFVSSGFFPLDLPRLTAALLAGQPVETSFDVIAWLFPGMGAGSGGTAVAAEDTARAMEAGPRRGGGVLARTPGPVAAQTSHMYSVVSPKKADSARYAVKALMAVMLADGQIRAGERRFLDGFVARAGLPPLEDADIRPWRPSEVGIPADPEPVIAAMIELAFIDRERDGSEWRVVREFARSWGYPLDKLEALGRGKEEEVASAMTRLWRSLRRLVITEELG